MKIKIYVLAIALSLLFSVMLVAIGGEATYVEEVDESLESEPELAQLADSPWPSFGHDQRNNRRSPYDTSHVDGTEKWSFEIDDEVDMYSSAAIDEDGTIYVGSHDNNLYALESDGTEKWSFETGNSLYSSPAIDEDGTIYVGSYDNYLYAINPDGTEKWSFETDDGILSSPTIADDGTIYVGSWDANLYAVNPDGTEKWSFETGDEIWSSPGIGEDGTIYIGSHDGNLYAVNLEDGTEEWSFEIGNNFWTTPTIADDGTIYVGGGDENLYAINPDGSERWSFEIGWEPTPNPAIGDDGTIYVGGGDENLYAINPDGSERWTFNTGGFVQSAPAVGGDGTIYIGSANTFLHAVNQDGTEKWSFQTDGEVRSSPSIGEDGTVYVGSHDGNLYAITGEHTLTVEEPTGEGSIEINDNEITSWPYQGDYEHGTEVELEAIAEDNWYFEEWAGDYTGEDNPTTITMDSEKEITAIFDTDQESYELEIKIEGEGTVEVDGTEFDDGDTDTYLEGTSLTLEAIPDVGWEFDEWQGTDETGESITINMDEQKSITAHFEYDDDVNGDYSDSITDDEGDVFYYYQDEDSWGWQENVERPDIDIIRASIEESGGEIFVELEVKGTIQEDVEVWYVITLEDEEGDSYKMGHWQGTGYLDHPTGGMYIEPSGFGTNTLEITFSLDDVGNPDSLEIVEVETHDWIDAEGEGAYYYDTAGPEATEPDVEDDEDEIDPEGVLDDLFARGMMCIALVIIIPIIVIVIIIVVVIKILGSGDEEDQEPSEQGPPPQQQQPPEQPPEQQQPPSPPEDQGGSGEAPPPPGSE